MIDTKIMLKHGESWLKGIEYELFMQIKKAGIRKGFCFFVRKISSIRLGISTKFYESYI